MLKKWVKDCKILFGSFESKHNNKTKLKLCRSWYEYGCANTQTVCSILILFFTSVTILAISTPSIPTFKNVDANYNVAEQCSYVNNELILIKIYMMIMCVGIIGLIHMLMIPTLLDLYNLASEIKLTKKLLAQMDEHLE